MRDSPGQVDGKCKSTTKVITSAEIRYNLCTFVNDGPNYASAAGEASRIRCQKDREGPARKHYAKSTRRLYSDRYASALSSAVRKSPAARDADGFQREPSQTPQQRQRFDA